MLRIKKHSPYFSKGFIIMNLSTDDIQQTKDFNVIIDLIVDIKKTLIFTPDTLQNIIIGTYSVLRNDHSQANFIRNAIDNFYYFLISINAHEDDIIRNRMISLLSLKNDILLQMNLSQENINIYLREAKFLLGNKSYLRLTSIPATFLKACEIIAKIQYAYIITSSSTDIRELYREIIDGIHKDNKIPERFDSLGKCNKVGYDYLNLGLVYMYYQLFAYVSKDDEDQNIIGRNAIMHPIVAYWKRNKIVYYDMTYEDFLNEGFNSYDFIWR